MSSVGILGMFVIAASDAGVFVREHHDRRTEFRSELEWNSGEQNNKGWKYEDAIRQFECRVLRTGRTYHGGGSAGSAPKVQDGRLRQNT